MGKISKWSNLYLKQRNGKWRKVAEAPIKQFSVISLVGIFKEWAKAKGKELSDIEATRMANLFREKPNPIFIPRRHRR